MLYKSTEIRSYIRIFGLVIPLAITRTWLYLTTTVTSSIFVLLPLALITYHQYYVTLIPLANSPVIPLNFTESGVNSQNWQSLQNTEDWGSWGSVPVYQENNETKVEGETQTLSHDDGNIKILKPKTYLSNLISPHFRNYNFDENSPYIFKVRLNIICPTNNNPAYGQMPHYMSSSPMQPPYQHSSSHLPTSTYPSRQLINKIRYNIQNSVLDQFTQGSFILNCDPLQIYQLKNKLVPYNLRYWVSPNVVDYAQSRSIELDVFEIKGSQLAHNKHLPRNGETFLFDDFKIEMDSQGENSGGYIIEDYVSHAWFEIKWTGFRYYLVKYYYTFYILGTAVFFAIMLLVSVVTGYGILWINHRRNEGNKGRGFKNSEVDYSSKIKSEPRIKIEGQR